MKRSQQAASVRRELQSRIKEMLENEVPLEEVGLLLAPINNSMIIYFQSLLPKVVTDVKAQMQTLAIAEPDVVILVSLVV